MAKLSEIVKVKISNDPLTNYERWVVTNEFHVNNDHIDLATVANYFDNGIEVKLERLKPFPVTLSAQNSTKVNPANGNSVEDGEDAKKCTMGEYDYLCTVANNPLNIFDLMKAVIARADVRGRYNK